jgi:hypothetical protein
MGGEGFWWPSIIIDCFASDESADPYLYSKSESGPPGQYTHTLPVMAMWGHLCGLLITATTATPEAVRIGLTEIVIIILAGVRNEEEGENY